MSERTEGGEMGSSIVEHVGREVRGDLGVRAVARDIRRTRRGRICFPSEAV